MRQDKARRATLLLALVLHRIVLLLRDPHRADCHDPSAIKWMLHYWELQPCSRKWGWCTRA